MSVPLAAVGRRKLRLGYRERRWPAVPPPAGRSGVERTEIRIPSSSIVTSPIPESSTIRTISRTRSARLLVDCRLVAVAPAAPADSAQQLLGVLAEQAEQEQLLLARGDALGALAHLVERRRDVLLALRVGRELNDALECGIDRRGRLAEGAGHEAPNLVDDHEVAARREDVDDRLRREHLADRRRERRPARLGADPVELLEHLVEPVAGALRLQRVVDPGHDAGGQVVARRENGDARHERGHELVADVLVDEIGRLPEPFDVDAGVEPGAAERLRERLARDPVQGQGERVDGAGDELRARVSCRERDGERAAAGSLGVDPDREPARVGERA